MPVALILSAAVAHVLDGASGKPKSFPRHSTSIDMASASLAHALAAVAAESARSAGGTGRKAFTWAHGVMISMVTPFV